MAAQSAFACGVVCACLFGTSKSRLLGTALGLLLSPVALLPSAFCFSQSYAGTRGLRRRSSYNLFMLSLSGLLFIVGAFAFFIMLLVAFSS
jgi:hypothetical protein